MSDLHIGYERFEEDSYKQAREALEGAASAADAVLIAGDIFDKRAPRPDVIAKAVDIFRDLSQMPWKARVASYKSSNGGKSHTVVPVIVISGTHERVAEGKDNVLSILALAGLVVDISESTAVLESDGEKVAVTGLGGVSEERVRECLQKLDPRPVPGAFNVFMLHQSIYELLPFDENIIRYEDLPKGFDLYINGHIHSRVEAVVHGKKFLIPGSTLLTQLKENEQERKGFILFDTKSYTHEFKAIRSRPFTLVNLQFKDATPKSIADSSESAIEGILQKSGEKPIIRIVLQGTIAHGFTNADMPLRGIVSRYSDRSFLEIDSSKLRSPDTEQEIESIREGTIGGMSIKELGVNSFVSKLKEQKFDDGIDARRLFEVLSGSSSKEKALKEASELLESEK